MNTDKRIRIGGTYTALITPFKHNRVDPDRFAEQIERQVRAEVTGIVPAGTTGESPTLIPGEHINLIKLAVELAAGRVQVIAGTGSNSTAEAIDLTKTAEDVGASASLQVAPYYNRPSRAGLVAHFGAVAKATNLPIILYNIPSRTGVDIDVRTVKTLASEYPNIVGIKEASGKVERVTELRREVGESFAVLSGDDGLTLPFISLGAVGVVSVLSNLLPELVKSMTDAALRDDFRCARRVFDSLAPLVTLLFAEGNPVGIKCAMKAVGLDNGESRLPLAPASEELRERIFQRVLLVDFSDVLIGE